MNIATISNLCTDAFKKMLGEIDPRFSRMVINLPQGPPEETALKEAESKLTDFCYRSNAWGHKYGRMNGRTLDSRLTKHGDVAKELRDFFARLHTLFLQGQEIVKEAREHRQEINMHNWYCLPGPAGERLHDCVESTFKELDEFHVFRTGKLQKALDAYLDTGFVYDGPGDRAYATMGITEITARCYSNLTLLLNSVKSRDDKHPEDEVIQALQRSFNAFKFWLTYFDVWGSKERLPIDERLEDRALINKIKTIVCNLHEQSDKGFRTVMTPIFASELTWMELDENTRKELEPFQEGIAKDVRELISLSYDRLQPFWSEKEEKKSFWKRIFH
ncbi:hypothetical protein ASPCAL12907 [Aspergillus calidoustus]|uniref:Uncharacterized protein n=1 Tax=Aspergillus calidoustus TaxID=454130 RepID=A0A0U5GBS4_ASPCI|nr:hypothetical protein ASPCAL12907 [Aspergillus calidoustus]